MKKAVFIVLIFLSITGCRITAPELFGITGFTFELINNPNLTTPVSATISGTTIKAVFPYDTDITSLSPTIELTDDAVVMPQSISRMNFSFPVFYLVTSVDETKSLTYTATVSLEEK